MTATFRELRPQSRPARAGSIRVGLIAVVATLLVGGWLFVIGPHSGNEQRSGAPFLQQALGAESAHAPFLRRPAPGVAVAVQRKRTVIRRDGHALSLAAVGAGDAAWRGFEHGASRRTPFGHETVTVDSTRTEEFLTVTRRVGVRTWRWQLGSTTLEPNLRQNGSIELRAGARVAGLRLDPAAIFDVAGNDITPAGARWSLERNAQGWNLALRLDDSKLPVPYVIDPAANYPTPLYFSSTASGGTVLTNGWNIVTGAPSGANTATVTQPARSATGYEVWQPGVNPNTTATVASLPAAPSGRGWILNSGSTGFPGGQWDFKVETAASSTTTENTIVAVQMWKVVLNGAGGITSSTAISGLGDDPAAQNIRANGDTLVHGWTLSYPSVGAFNLGATERLYVEFYRKQVTGMATFTAANRNMTFYSNDGANTEISAHPAADDVVPTHSLTLTPVTGGSWYDSAAQKIWYRGSAVGSFKLNDALSDGGSGANSVTYPAIATTNWTHNVETVSTGPNFTSTTFSWSVANPANPASKNITGDDKALNPAAALAVSFGTDTAVPGDPTGLALVGGPYYTTASIGLTPTDGSDGAGSGIDTASRAYERDTVTLAGDTCPAFTSTWTAVTLTAGADTTAVNGKCYRYRYKVSDHVGNQSAGYSPVSGTAKVDLTKPVNPTFAFSALTAASSNGTDTVWYKPTAAAGAFTITASSTDPETNISSYTFPAAASGWTRSLAGAAATYSHTGAPTDPAEPNNVTATNNASNASNAVSFTVTPDPNAPSGMSASVTGGYYTSASVHVTLANGSDGVGESGVDATSGIVERDQANLATGTCAAFPGSWSTVTLDGSGNDTSVVGGKCYVYRYKISDKVGNQGTQSGTSATAKVDTTGPLAPTFAFSGLTNAWDNGSGTIYFKGNAAGGFTVTPTATDAESGVSSYVYPALGGTWSNTAGAYTFTTTSPDPTEPNNVHGVNGAGGAGTDASFTVTKDSNAPTGMSASVTGGYYTSTSIHVTLANGSDGAGESGVDATSGIVERDQANLAGNSCAAFPGTWSTVTLNGSGDDTTVASGKCYVYRYKISDRVGNQGTQAGTSATAKVDTTGPGAPSFAFSGFTNAWENGSGTVFFKGNAAGGFTVSPTATDTETGVASYAYPALGSGWAGGGAYTFNSSAIDPVEPNNVHGVNNAGSAGADGSFTITKDSNAPSGMSASVTGGYFGAASIHVTLANGSDGAGESGVDAATGIVERDQSNLAAGSCAAFPGTWSTVTLDGSGNDTTVLSGKCYVYRYKISDRVGNQGTQAGTSATAKVDTSKPSTPSLTFSAATNAYDNGSGTLFFRSGAAGGFTVAASSTDAESGIASTTFPALAAGWSHTAGTYTFTSAAADPVEPNDVYTTNGAGLDSLHQSFTVTADGNAPTGMSATVTGGFTGSTSVAVTLANGSDGAGESGVDATSGIVERDEAPLLAGACNPFPGSWTTVTLSGGNDTTLQTGKCYRYRYKISDRVGNQGVSAASAAVKVDTTPPGAPTLAFSAFTRSWEDGSGTVYYKGGAAGGFTVTGSATDAESGIASYVYPTLDSGWNNGPVYSFSLAADPVEPNNVHAVNGAGIAGADTSFTVTMDSSAPTGISASVTGGYVSSLSVPVTLVNGSDTGSGVDASSGIVERDESALANGSCASFPGSWATVTLTGGVDTTVQTAKCYRYRYNVSDRVGNQGTQAGASATVKVDTTPPSAPSFAFSAFTNATASGTTVFYRPGAAGGFTVAPSATDAQSGVSSYAYPALGAGWSNASGAFSFAVGAADPTEPNNVHATNGAGSSGADSSFTVTADSAAPTTTAACNGGSCAGWSGASVLVSLSASDGTGSGVANTKYTTDGTDPTTSFTAVTYSVPFSVTGTTTVKFSSTDAVGNLEAVGSQLVQIDSTSPTATLTNPGANLRGTVTLDATASDSESGVASVAFQRSAAGSGGPWTTIATDNSFPYSTSFNTTLVSDGQYDLRAVATDGVSNAGNSAVVGSRRVDNTAPTVTMGNPGSQLSDTVTLTSTPTDGTGSGIASVTYEYERSTVPGVWTAIGTSSSTPFSLAWDTTTVSDGRYDLRAKTVDVAGNVSAYSATINNKQVRNHPPIVSITAPGDFVNASAANPFTITATATSSVAGIDNIEFFHCSNASVGCGTGTWVSLGQDFSSPYSASWSLDPEGHRAIKALVTDVNGSTGQDILEVTIDRTLPTGGSVSYVDGWSGSPVAITTNNGNDGSGSGLDLTTTLLQRDAVAYSAGSCGAFPGAWTTVSAPDATAANSTCYRYRYKISDNAGNTQTYAPAYVAKVDTGAPSNSLSLTGVSPAGSALQSGSTIFYRGAAAGSFQLRNAASDSLSGAGSSASAALSGSASGWSHTPSTVSTPAGGPYDSAAFSWSAGTTSSPTETVTGADQAGNGTAAAALTFTNDSGAPATTIACAPASGCSGWANSSPVTVTLTSDDGSGAGVNQIKYTTDGSDPATSGTATTVAGSGATVPVASTKTLKYLATDKVGNAEAVKTQLVQVDTSKPSTPTLSFGSFTNASMSASTVFYRPGVAGAFSVTASSSDAESGVASYGFPALGGGFSASGTGASRDYSYSGTPTEPGAGQNVTAVNGASLTSDPAAFAVRADASAPTTAAVCVPAAACTGWSTTSPVVVTLNAGDGTGAGVLETRYTTDGSTPGPLSQLYVGPISLAANTTLKYRSYDKVGNVEAVASLTVQVDASVPTIDSLTVSESPAGPNAFVSGTEIFYNPNGTNSGSFTVDVTAHDNESGIDYVSFPALSGITGGGDFSAAPFSATYGWSSSSTTSPGSSTVTAWNPAGLSATAGFTVTKDAAAPTGMSASVTGGYLTSTSVAVSLANGSDPAGGSGLDTSTRIVERDAASLVGGTCDPFPGSWQAVTLTGGNDTTLQNGTCYRYRVRISDNVGNQGTQAGTSATVQVDTSAPSTPSLAFGSLSAAYDNGSGTVYYRPGAASGAFTLTASSSDPQSGIAAYTFPSAASGWTRNVSGASATYSHSGSPSEPGAGQLVHATNNAGTDSGNSSFAVMADSSLPTSSMQCDGAACPSGWVATTPVSITLSASDSGSGLDRIVYTTDGSDPASGGTTYSGAFDVAASTTVKWLAYDRVGNAEAAHSKTIQIDATPPSTPTLSYSALSNAVAVGGTVYFRPGAAGGFTVTASSSDPESSVASYSFPALGAGWSASGSGATRTYTFTSAAVDPTEPNPVTALNGSGQSSAAAALVVDADSTAPAGGSVSYTDGYRSSASVALTLDDGTDGGAGLDTSTEVLERSVGTLANGGCTSFGTFTTLATDPALSYSDTSVLTGKCYVYRYVVQDRVGNARTYTSSSVAKVDLDAPAATQGNPGAYMRGSVTLTGTGTDTGGSDVASLAFQYSDDAGATWKPIATDSASPYSVSFDTTTAATPDGLYDLRTVATDGAGNTSPSPVVSGRRIDNTAPSASISSPAADVRAVVNLSATTSDSGSGISSTAYQFSNDGGATWTTTPASWNTALSADGIYRVRVVATDNAGNQATDTSGNFRVDNTPPTASLDDPGPYLRGTVNLTSTTGDSGSGVDTVTYERSPAGAGTWTTVAAAWNTTAAADGLYDLRVVVVDRAGNPTNSALQTGRRVDNTKPSVSLDNPTSNADVAGTVTLASTANDAGSGLAVPVTYEYRVHSGGPWTSTPAAWDTTLLADGGYDLRATAFDRAGNSQQSNVAANVRVDNTPPTISLTAPANGGYVNAAATDPYSLAATANDAGSGVKQVEFFQCSNASVGCTTGTWSSVAVDSAPGPFGVAWTIPGDGHRALRAVATDSADRTAASVIDVTVDRTLPETSIVTKPGDPSNEASPTFTFGSSEPGSTFQCSLDGGTYAACTSPDVLPALADGTHDFSVRAVDVAGNTDLSAASWSWLTDLTPPTATIDNPGANVRGVVSLTSTQDDPGGANASGVATVSYEYSADDGTSWAPTPASWDTAPITDGLYKLRVIVLDNAGNETIDTLGADVRVDNTAPTSSQDDPGQYLRQTVPLSGSAADPDDPAGRPGSGVTEVRFEVSPAGADTWTSVGTAASEPYGTSLDTSTLADGRYDFRTVATDAAGNEAPGGTVTNRLVDNTAPDATMGDPGANLRGTVTLSSTTVDPGANASGLAGVDYEISSGGGWTPVADNWSTTSVADGLYDVRVVATDRAGNSTTSSAVGGRRVDNTRPSTSDDAPSGYQSTPVTVHLSASDSGSGVSVTEYSVDGGGFQAGTSVSVPAPANGSNDGTHTISYFSADVAGNIEATKSTTVDIDATPPVCPTCTADDYLTGNETLSASPGGSLSGIKSVTFEYADEGAPRTSPPPGTWHTIGTDTTSPYSVGWNTTTVADGAYDLRIVIKNNAGVSSTTYLDSKVVDNTAPSAGVGAPAAGALVSGDVTFAATAGDDNPIASVEFRVGGRSIATVTGPPFRTTWATTGDPDGGASLQVVVTDIAGNSTTSASRSVTIDNNAPSPTLADPGSGVSGNVTLTASSDADTVRVDIQRSPAGANHWTTIGSPTSAPFSVSFDSSFLVDGSYDLRAVATDQSGHVGTSGVVTTRVDNTAPSASLTRPSAGATVGGPAVQLTASASDATSGVASVRFQYRTTGGGGFTDIADDTSAPFAVSWDATTLATGSYDLRVVATDGSGNVATTAPVTVSVDSTAPIVVLDDPGANLSGSVTLTATTSGSPAANVRFERSPAGASNWTAIATDGGAPWSAAFNTAPLADGLYDLRAVAADSYGNERASVRPGIRIDNGAPSIVSSTPADGAVVASANSIALVASEALASINGATLDGAGVVAPIISGAHVTYPVGTLGAGSHTLAGTLEDESGKTRAFELHFTVWSSGGGGGVGVEENALRDRSTTVTSADGSASATMPAGAWAANGADWLVLRIEMKAAPAGLAGPLDFASNVADVTARWALAGSQCHDFDLPLTIDIASAASNVAGATNQGGAWRMLRRVPVDGVLPAGWSDGYWVDSGGMHILTLHLSEFAVVRDLTPPTSSGGTDAGSTGSGSGSTGSGGTTTTTTTTATTTVPHPQTRLSMRVVSTKLFRPGRQVRIGARIVSTRDAIGTVALRNAAGSQLATWAFRVKTGSNVRTFRMPAAVRKAGRYTLAWRLTTDGDSASQTTRLTIASSRRAAAAGVARRPDVVLAAAGFSARSLGLPATMRVLQASAKADAFDLTGATNTNVRVVVLDVDRFGLSFLHDLYTVFPDVRIVAIAGAPSVRRRALDAGASAALPRRVGPARVGSAVRRLARG